MGVTAVGGIILVYRGISKNARAIEAVEDKLERFIANVTQRMKACGQGLEDEFGPPKK